MYGQRLVCYLPIDLIKKRIKANPVGDVVHLRRGFVHILWGSVDLSTFGIDGDMAGWTQIVYI